jgi:hypothetical protein
MNYLMLIDSGLDLQARFMWICPNYSLLVKSEMDYDLLIFFKSSDQKRDKIIDMSR